MICYHWLFVSLRLYRLQTPSNQGTQRIRCTPPGRDLRGFPGCLGQLATETCQRRIDRDAATSPPARSQRAETAFRLQQPANVWAYWRTRASTQTIGTRMAYLLRQRLRCKSLVPRVTRCANSIDKTARVENKLISGSIIC